jgi:phage gpG-like protein
LTAAVTFQWIPDPKVHAATFAQQASEFANPAIPIAAAAGAIRHDIRQRFETETDPWGNRWADWSESYTPRAMAYPNEGILKQSGDLFRVATATTATVVTNDTVFYETGKLPHYGLAHEQGLPFRETPLPQRSFLGISAEAAAVIYGYFGEWFDHIIELYPTSTGKLGRRWAFRAAPGGFFLPRSAL